MMMGGGSMAGMIVSLRNNKKLLRARGMFKKDSGYLSGKQKFLKATKGQIDLKKATPEDFKKVRRTISQNRKNERRNYLFAGVFCLILSILVYQGASNFFTSNNWNPHRIMSKNDVFGNQSEKLKLDYIFYLEQGDKYIIEKHWHNAIFQYSKALEIFPNEFDANYRLALAHSYSCKQSKKRCDEAKYLIEKLEKQFPKNGNIIELKSLLE